MRNLFRFSGFATLAKSRVERNFMQICETFFSAVLLLLALRYRAPVQISTEALFVCLFFPYGKHAQSHRYVTISVLEGSNTGALLKLPLCKASFMLTKLRKDDQKTATRLLFLFHFHFRFRFLGCLFRIVAPKWVNGKYVPYGIRFLYVWLNCS